MRRVTFFVFLITLFIFSPKDVLAACGDSITGGTGTSGDPYQINDATELAAISNCLGSGNSGKYFKLMNDIDLDVSPYNSGSGWVAIGTNANYTLSGRADTALTSAAFLRFELLWSRTEFMA